MVVTMVKTKCLALGVWDYELGFHPLQLRCFFNPQIIMELHPLRNLLQTNIYCVYIYIYVEKPAL